jgi:hypothetical protein
VKRGATSFFVQRWNDSRNVLGFVPEPGHDQAVEHLKAPTDAPTS